MITTIKCNICSGSGLENIMTLPNYPLNSIYIRKREEERVKRLKPRKFSLHFCNDCGHFQGISDVQLRELYNEEYNYNTKNSGVRGRIEFFTSQLKEIEHIKFNRVIDVGCYDLSLLTVVKHMIKAEHYIGIDPSIPEAFVNNDDGIICFKDYVDNVQIPYLDNSLPDLIISDQTFEHIPSIHSTLGNISEKVSENSIFAICVPSMEVLIDKLNFHNLIHEHVNYFSIFTLVKLFSLNQLSLQSYKLNYTSTCGFLFGLFAKKKGLINQMVLKGNFISKERFLERFKVFTNLIEITLATLQDFKGEKIYGFGASDITANLAYFMNSDLSFLHNILDDTVYKQNRYFPFLAPEIISQNGMDDLRASHCLITSPQASRYIYARINDLGFKTIINPVGLLA